MGLLNPGGPIAQFERNDCLISPVEVISRGGVRSISKTAQEGTKKYAIHVILGGLFGSGIASFVPYQWLINILYGLNGYLGILLVVFMLIYDIRTRMSATVA